MVVVGGELLALLLSVTGGLVDVFGSRIRVQGRDTLPGELEVIGPVEISLLGFGVWLDHAPLPGGYLSGNVVEGGIAKADDNDVPGPAPLVDAVDVDIGQRLLEWVQGILGVIFCAEQPLLLSRQRRKQNRAPGFLPQPGERPGDFQKAGGAGGVIDGAVVDLVAGQGLVPAKVVPVGGIDHVLVLELRIAALQLRDHVPRLDAPERVVETETRPGVERHGAEILPHRGLLEFVKAFAASREQLLRLLQRDPGFHGDLAHILVRGVDVEVLASPSGADDGPRVTCRAGLVNNHGGRGAFAGGDLVLVGPAAVISHGPALEHFLVQFRGVGGVRNRRVVD